MLEPRSDWSVLPIAPRDPPGRVDVPCHEIFVEIARFLKPEYLSMSTYKLTYFKVRARAEVIRFVFAQAEVKYEDVRVSEENWPELKPHTPLGHLPILEVDGKTICGSTGIARFLAERFGLAGSKDIENAQIWGFVDETSDLLEKAYKPYFEKDEAKKAEMVKELQEKTFPSILGCFEKQASKSGAPEGWIFGKLTYVDFYFYTALENTLKQTPTLLDNFPTLKKLWSSVEALPNIAKWLKERPETRL